MAVPFIDLKAQYKALKPEIDGRIAAVLDHGAYVMGPEITELEEKLAKFTGTKHCVACSSGTDALLMAMMAIDIQPGDEVITTAFSFIATAEMIVFLKAVPVYIDVDPFTFNIDPKKIEAAITDKTKAIVPVSLYGQPAEMEEINAIAKKHKLTVIEDAAQSFGAPYKNRKSCGLSDMGTTSFFPAKPLGCFGDGGAIFTDNDDLFEKLKMVRNHGQETRYYHTSIGINGRMDTLQAAILLAKMERYPWEIEQRNRWASRYNEHFAGLTSKGVGLPILKEDRGSVWAQYTLRVPKREPFQAALKEKGVPTAVHYPGTMPAQPAYQNSGRITDISIAEKAAQEVVSLPIYPDMTEAIQDEVIAAVHSTFS